MKAKADRCKLSNRQRFDILKRDGFTCSVAWRRPNIENRLTYFNGVLRTKMRETFARG